MDDIIVKSRYSRNSPAYRRRKSRVKENSKLGETIKIQILISTLILLLIWGISKINTTITQFIIGKVKWVLSSDMDIDDMYSQINEILRINDGKTEKDKVKENINDNINNNINSNINNNTSNNINNNEDNNKDGKSDNKGDNKSDNKNNSKNNNESGNDSYIGNNRDIGLEFILPVEGVVSSFFGERLDPVTNKIKYHSGIDIEASVNSQIKAAEDGKVIEVSEHRMYGKYIKLEHFGGTITIYAHCSKILINEGAKVNKGDIIAEVGNTGVSTGSHLHFEIWINEEPKNPLEFIKVPIKTNPNEIL